MAIRLTWFVGDRLEDAAYDAGIRAAIFSTFGANTTDFIVCSLADVV